MAQNPTAEFDCTFIGCGPVGCLMAVFLRGLGLTCEIWEKRPDPRINPDQGKSINLTLSARGYLALHQLKAEDRQLLDCLRKAIPTPGRKIHRLNQPIAYQPYSENPEEVLYSVSRKNLNNDLLNVAEKNDVKVNFGYFLESVDWKTKLASFSTKTGERLVRKFNTLWGTDGSNSMLRAEIERCHDVVGNTEKYDSGYKEFYLSAGKGGVARIDEGCLHVWPRNCQTFFVGLPNPDGSFTCTLFSPSSGPECIGNFTTEQILALFQTQFPDVYALMGPENIVQNHKTNPFGSLYNVDTPKWSVRGDAVILGDSAFGVVPYYGLGINVGMESVRHLINLVKLYRTGPKSFDWERIFSEFNKFKPHVDVLRIESARNAVELHKKVDDSHFLFKKEVERLLQHKYPRRFVEAHSMLSFTNIPLEVCGRAIQIQEQIATQLCENKTRIEDLDWEQADALISQFCSADLFLEKMWYETEPPPDNFTEIVKHFKVQPAKL